MSKLFVGCDVPTEWGETLQKELSDLLGGEKQENFHITFQWCGLEVTDDDARAINGIWVEAMAQLKVEDLKVELTKEFALFGKEENLLVVKCHVSEALEDAVERARQNTIKSVASVPESEFKFSPHVTLGESIHLPTPEAAEKALSQIESTSFRLATVQLWRDGYEPQSTFLVGPVTSV